MIVSTHSDLISAVTGAVGALKGLALFTWHLLAVPGCLCSRPGSSSWEGVRALISGQRFAVVKPTLLRHRLNQRNPVVVGADRTTGLENEVNQVNIAEIGQRTRIHREATEGKVDNEGKPALLPRLVDATCSPYRVGIARAHLHIEVDSNRIGIEMDSELAEAAEVQIQWGDDRFTVLDVQTPKHFQPMMGPNAGTNDQDRRFRFDIESSGLIEFVEAN